MAKSARTPASSKGSASKKAAAPKKGAVTTAAKKSSVSKRSTATAQVDDATALRELFVEELRDIYYAEKLLVKTLPKLAKAATSEELRGAFEDHLTVTEEQVGRVEEVFEMLDLPSRAKKCDAMEGLVKEAQSAIQDLPKGTMVRDAGLIICAQKVEHYEIAAYGSLVQLARTMGEDEVAEVLQQTLNEEKESDELLTQLAISGINLKAQNEEGEEAED